MEKIHPWVLALPAAGTAGIVYAVCAALVATAPSAAEGLTQLLFHTVSLEVGTVTAATFVAGIVASFVITFVVASVFAVLYNSCLGHCRKRGWKV